MAIALDGKTALGARDATLGMSAGNAALAAQPEARDLEVVSGPGYMSPEHQKIAQLHERWSQYLGDNKFQISGYNDQILSGVRDAVLTDLTRAALGVDAIRAGRESAAVLLERLPEQQKLALQISKHDASLSQMLKGGFDALPDGVLDLIKTGRHLGQEVAKELRAQSGPLRQREAEEKLNGEKEGFIRRFKDAEPSLGARTVDLCESIVQSVKAKSGDFKAAAFKPVTDQIQSDLDHNIIQKPRAIEMIRLVNDCIGWARDVTRPDFVPAPPRPAAAPKVEVNYFDGRHDHENDSFRLQFRQRADGYYAIVSSTKELMGGMPWNRHSIGNPTIEFRIASGGFGENQATARATANEIAQEALAKASTYDSVFRDVDGKTVNLRSELYQLLKGRAELARATNKADLGRDAKTWERLEVLS